MFSYRRPKKIHESSPYLWGAVWWEKCERVKSFFFCTVFKVDKEHGHAHIVGSMLTGQ